MKEFKSFIHAIKGIMRCIKNEKHMRIHICVSLYVLIFTPFFNLSSEKYAILLLTISAVFTAEMVNTSAEVLSDICAEDYNRMAKIAKDIAAGAVFICAFFSIVIGIMFFGNIESFINIFKYFIEHGILFVLFILSVIVSILFVILGPIEIKNRIKSLIFKKRIKK